MLEVSPLAGQETEDDTAVLEKNSNDDSVHALDGEAQTLLAPLFQKRHHLFVALAMKYGCDYQDAEDLVQNAYLKAREKLHQLNDPTSCESWVRMIIVRLAINFSKTRTRFQPFSYVFPDLHPGNKKKTAIQDDQIYIPIEQQETKELVHTAMESLDPFSHQALNDFYIRGLPVKEIALERNVPIGTVQRRLFTARHRLREALCTQNISLDDL